MPVKWNLDSDNLVVFYVSGKLGKAEYLQIQSEIESVIKQIGQIRILVLLNDFDGWETASGWEDTSFVDRNDPYIKKFAIVGDQQWRGLVSAFTLQGLRPVPIEYFTEDKEAVARQWLES